LDRIPGLQCLGRAINHPILRSEACRNLDGVTKIPASAGTESVVPVAKSIQTMPASAFGSAMTITNGSSQGLKVDDGQQIDQDELIPTRLKSDTRPIAGSN
jgi:hypothetical protein